MQIDEGFFGSSPATGTAKGGEGSPWDIGPGSGGTCGEISVVEETISGSFGGGSGGGDGPIGEDGQYFTGER